MRTSFKLEPELDYADDICHEPTPTTSTFNKVKNKRKLLIERNNSRPLSTSDEARKNANKKAAKDYRARKKQRNQNLGDNFDFCRLVFNSHGGLHIGELIPISSKLIMNLGNPEHVDYLIREFEDDNDDGVNQIRNTKYNTITIDDMYYKKCVELSKKIKGKKPRNLQWRYDISVDAMRLRKHRHLQNKSETSMAINIVYMRYAYEIQTGLRLKLKDHKALTVDNSVNKLLSIVSSAGIDLKRVFLRNLPYLPSCFCFVKLLNMVKERIDGGNKQHDERTQAGGGRDILARAISLSSCLAHEEFMKYEEGDEACHCHQLAPLC